MNEKYRNKKIMFFPLMVFLIFAVLMIGLCIYSANFYKGISDNSEHRFKETVFSNYIRTKVRSDSGESNLEVLEHDGKNVIRIIDSRNYATYIYYSKGNLYEAYQDSSKSFDYESGSKIIDIDDFKVSISDNRLIASMKDRDNWKKVVVGLRNED